MAENARERSASEEVRRAAWSLAIFRCARPGCRRHGKLELHEIAPGRGPLREERTVYLCPACHRRARRGEFSTAQMQLWRLALRTIWEDVGAE